MAIGIDVSIYAKTELLLSPLGVRIVAAKGAEVDGDQIVTVPARGANCSYNYAGIQCKGHLFSGYLYTIFHLIFYIVVQNP